MNLVGGASTPRPARPWASIKAAWAAIIEYAVLLRSVAFAGGCALIAGHDTNGLNVQDAIVCASVGVGSYGTMAATLGVSAKLSDRRRRHYRHRGMAEQQPRFATSSHPPVSGERRGYMRTRIERGQTTNHAFLTSVSL